MKRLPLPQGQGSLRPTFSSSNFSPWTKRTPRFTFVSEGNPLRRFLIVSKKRPFVVGSFGHETPSFPHTGHNIEQRPRQESNLVSGTDAQRWSLRKVACVPAHSEDISIPQHLARESNPVLLFRRLPCCPLHSQGSYLVRFADGAEVKAHFAELSLRRREVDDILGDVDEDRRTLHHPAPLSSLPGFLHDATEVDRQGGAQTRQASAVRLPRPHDRQPVNRNHHCPLSTCLMWQSKNSFTSSNRLASLN